MKHGYNSGLYRWVAETRSRGAEEAAPSSSHGNEREAVSSDFEIDLLVRPKPRTMWGSAGDPGTTSYLHLLALSLAQGNAPTGARSAEDVPAGYTYLCQLIFHDLSRSKVHAEFSTWEFAADLPDEIRQKHSRIDRTVENLNTPMLDLDTLYGQGPLVEPQMFKRESGDDSERCRFKLGEAGGAILAETTPRTTFCPFDLARINASGATFDPVIADVRNDDHPLLSQMLGLLKNLHNKIIDSLKKKGFSNRKSYELARIHLTKIYRYVIINDVMRRILHEDIYRDFLEKDPRLLSQFKLDSNQLPAEFTFAASRFGHAMVRNRYLLNESFADGEGISDRGRIQEVLRFSSLRENPTLPLPADWNIDWRFFFDDFTDSVGDDLLIAQPISPFFAPGLVTGAEFELITEEHKRQLLPQLDMERCLQFNLPTGQEFAQALADIAPTGITVPVLSGDAMKVSETNFVDDDIAEKLDAVISRRPDFYNQTPLSYYLLHEAAVSPSRGRKLGIAGSFIVAYTVRKALENSVINSLLDIRLYEEMADATSNQFINTMPKLLELTKLDSEQIAETVAATISEKKGARYRANENSRGKQKPRMRRFGEAGE